MEERKKKEREFHNRLMDESIRGHRPSNKFYSVVRRSRKLMDDWLQAQSQGRWALDFGCGDGSTTIELAQNGAQAVGIDISDKSLLEAKNSAAVKGVQDKAHFLVMDGENLGFTDDSFDIIVVRAILHHLDLDRALRELARVLKKDGTILCHEALADNPLIRFYRRRTPDERTAWEVDHLLHASDLKVAKRYFDKVDAQFFHFFVLAAVPFRKTRVFNGLLRVLEALDSFFLRLPLMKRLAWQTAFTLAEPKKVARN